MAYSGRCHFPLLGSGERTGSSVREVSLSADEAKKQKQAGKLVARDFQGSVCQVGSSEVGSILDHHHPLSSYNEMVLQERPALSSCVA